jgi:hypothetical protein
MEKGFLEDCLAKRMSLKTIGELASKHPSTVSSWLKKHGLEASNAERHAPKGSVDADRLHRMADDGDSIRRMANELDLGYSTVRYWLKRLGFETERSIRRKESDAARDAGLQKAYLRCPRHGHTAFFRRSDGGFRCVKCSITAVSRRRRQVKRRLVEEAGGKCRICGFKEHQSALQFHHRDPSTKLFHLGYRGMTKGISHMRAEAKKCVLLCANCHALVEAGIKEVPAEDR